MIKENLITVEENIGRACMRAGRNPSEVTLIAVSKTKPVSMIREAVDYGILEFGENKVQELVSKLDEMKEPLHWHMIGHLQRNKIKYIVDRVALIHSVDSKRLAIAIHEEAKKKNIRCPVLLEVNISGEESKYGLRPSEVLSILPELSRLSHIQIKGLMTIAPFVENAEENRMHFRNLRKLYVDIKTKNIDNITMDVLSMGMTGDYEVAIEEGATMVRVGTGIFGVRNYMGD